MDFGAIYERYGRDVLRFALYLSGNRGDAEEIAAETFVRAWVATGEIRVETLKAYLFSIARNLYIERYRRRGREGALPPDVRDRAPGPEAAASSRSELEGRDGGAARACRKSIAPRCCCGPTTCPTTRSRARSACRRPRRG